MDELMRDAAFPGNIDPASWDRAVAGYYGGPEAYNVWAQGDWKRFAKNRKLPIWVAGLDGHGEGQEALKALRALGVPRGSYTAVDFETREDGSYLDAFGNVLANGGYRVWVYGSASTVFNNPALDGYWVADYAGIGPFMFKRFGVEIRATQYASGPDFDSSTIKDFTYQDDSRWWR